MPETQTRRSFMPPEEPPRKRPLWRRVGGPAAAVAVLAAGGYLLTTQVLLTPPASGAAGEVVSDYAFSFVAAPPTCGIKEVERSVAKGEFCQLDLDVTNRSKRSSTFVTAATTGYVGDAKAVPQSIPAYAFSPVDLAFETQSTDVHAGETLHFRLFYDVPAGSTLSSVVVHRGSDLSFGGLLAAQTNGSRIDLTRSVAPAPGHTTTR